MQADLGKNVRRVYCIHKCGWHRDITEDLTWMSRIVDHPEYGQVIEADLVQLDLKNHNCMKYAEVRAKFRRNQNERNGRYRGSR
jgi:hypothetical protein